MKTVFIEALKDTPEKWVHFLPYVVRHPHLDLVGHMNNSQYLSIFEEGRWNLLAHFGVDQNYLMRECIAPVITQANLSFYKELRLGDRFLMISFMEPPQGRFVMSQYFFPWSLEIEQFFIQLQKNPPQDVSQYIPSTQSYLSQASIFQQHNFYQDPIKVKAMSYLKLDFVLIHTVERKIAKDAFQKGPWKDMLNN